ncbi:MAG: hypothetical protein ACN2B6_12080 [Rickettsiales bacterium]
MDELLARYDLDCKWREAWNLLANSDIRRTKYPLQTQQEYIERRAGMANKRVANIIQKVRAKWTDFGTSSAEWHYQKIEVIEEHMDKQMITTLDVFVKTVQTAVESAQELSYQGVGVTLSLDVALELVEAAKRLQKDSSLSAAEK